MSAFIPAPFDSQPRCRHVERPAQFWALPRRQRGVPLLTMPIASGSPEGIAKTFGTQLWEAEFSSLISRGFYALIIEFGISNGMHAFCTAPFEIRSRLVTSRMMKPLRFSMLSLGHAADEELLAQLDQRVRGLERRARGRISGRSR